ncbi:type IV pilus major pilin [Rahnella inusitata]|uniref:Type IV pilus major pilin n=2 Tax=Rahnella inusitata TaxID=58169 RepID=A0ABX9P550_9GAMM|nr:type IV pilus major pilin [Rahnella inusitata]
MENIMNKFVNKMKSKANKTLAMKKQRGMSLLEVIIVLGIIGTMAAAVVILAQRAFSSQDITDLVDNTNSVRVAAGNAYHDTGIYPSEAATALNLTPANMNESKGDTAPMAATLVQLGQVSVSEIKNGISGDFFTMKGVKVTGDAAENSTKGFILDVNGLDAGECRSLLTQLGNQWDYVEVATAAAGADPTAPDTLDGAVVITAAGGGPVGVMRSLASEGAVAITASSAAQACSENSDNAIILGSK